MTRSQSRLVRASLLVLWFFGPFHDCANSQSVSQSVSAQTDQTENPPSQEILKRIYRPAIFDSKDGGSLPYRILSPIGLSQRSDVIPSNRDDQTRRFPLVLFLHGAGERGKDNLKQLIHAAGDFAQRDRQRNNPAFVVCPQCPDGSQWVETPWDLPSGKGTFPETPSDPLRLAMELVQSLTESLPIDPDRVYVTGLSMGGYGAWHAAGLDPERFAAVLAVCGGSDPAWAPRYTRMPIWSFHGEKDTVVPIARGREIVSALVLAGHLGELRYTEYEGVGHNSWKRTFSRDDVHQWLFQQRRNQQRRTKPSKK